MADYKTREQLIEQVLDNLGVGAAGQAKAAEDTAKVDSLIDASFARLSALGIFDVPDSEEIQPEAFLALSNVVANDCAPSFALSGDERLAALARIAEGDLRMIVRAGSGSPLLTTDRALGAGRKWQW